MWCSFLSLVSTRRKSPTSFFVAVRLSAVANVTIIGVSGPVNSLCSLHIIAVAELTTINGIPSVSQEKALLPELALAAKALICNLVKGLCRFRWRMPLLKKTFEKIYAPMRLNQRLIRPCRIWYKYENSISTKDITYLSKPSGGYGNRSRKNAYGIARWSGSS